MKQNGFLTWSSALCLSAITLAAQETNQVELLRRQLREATENFDQIVRQQRLVIESLTKKIDALDQKNPAKPPPIELSPPPQPGTLSRPAAVAESAAVPPAVAPSSWSPAQPMTVARAGASYLNLSFDALMDAGWSSASDPSRQLNLGHHDPLQRGFSLRNAEIALDGAVDPYFKGFANIVMSLDRDNGTEIEVEEAFLQSTALPHNLQLKAGQFFANFGRQNSQHPHQWAFADAPLALTRFFGPDGLRNIGAQMSWLAPTPFYSEAFLGVFNSQGEQAFSFRNRGQPDLLGVDRFAGRMTSDRNLRGPGDLLFVPRLVTSFDLTDQQTLVMGASGAFAPNSTGAGLHTQVYGGDAYWKWKPANASEGFPFVSVQTEGLYRRFDAGADPGALLPRETLCDWGFYSQALWGFRPHWVAGLRGEYVNGNRGAFDPGDVVRGERTRLSPVLTWYPSEFSKIRLQYNYDRGRQFNDAHSVWLQLEFMLGAHGAHKF